jgi:oligopeptide/dipeptide ABC transporter ATP-binding protein
MPSEEKIPAIELQQIKKYFPVTKGVIRDRIVGYVKALDGVDLELNANEVVGLVGESGSGKSTLAKIILLLEQPTEGQLIFEGKDVSAFSGNDIKRYRQKIQAVFQDPYSSLSPRLKVKEIIAEPALVTGKLHRKEVDDMASEYLRMAGLNAGIRNVYPHELSGGQRQRVAIGRAISTQAAVIILDEPTSALDVSVRLQIVELLMKLQQKLGLSYLLIGHDLAMVAYMSTYIAVMYLGKIVEFTRTQELVQNPRHPYTRALISASLPAHPNEKKERITLAGEIANPFDIPSGCRFHPRCPDAKEECYHIDPLLKPILENHWVACNF